MEDDTALHLAVAKAVMIRDAQAIGKMLRLTWIARKDKEVVWKIVSFVGIPI